MTAAEANSRFTNAVIVTLSGTGATIVEWLRNGSLVLTVLGAALAVAGGVVAYRTRCKESRIRDIDMQRAMLERQRAEIELKRAKEA